MSGADSLFYRFVFVWRFEHVCVASTIVVEVGVPAHHTPERVAVGDAHPAKLRVSGRVRRTCIFQPGRVCRPLSVFTLGCGMLGDSPYWFLADHHSVRYTLHGVVDTPPM